MIITILSKDEVVCFELLVLPLDPLFHSGCGDGIESPIHSCLVPSLIKDKCLESR